MRLSNGLLSALSLTSVEVAAGLIALPVVAQFPENKSEQQLPSSESRFARPTDQSSAQFWPDAAKLLAQQADLLDRAEKAVTTPDPIENQITSTKLLVQLRSLDRFVARYYYNPRQLCLTPNPNLDKNSTKLSGAAAGLDGAQVETYCAIYQLSRELTPLRELLTQRSSLFNTSRSNSVALFFNQPQVAPFSAKTVEQVNLATRIPKQTAIEPFVYPKLVGTQRMKRRDTAYRPPAPAIAPPEDLLKIIRQGQEKVQQAQRQLPSTAIGMTTTNPITTSSFSTASKPEIAQSKMAQLQRAKLEKPEAAAEFDRFAVPQEEAALYKDFLKQDSTGIARVYPEQAFVGPINRLEPEHVPTPFGLRIQDGQFVITGQELDYGFLADVGDIELAQRSRLPIPNLFKTYQPPTTLADVQNHQRRFLVGKDTEFGSQVPASLYRTYVMRLVQYDLPDIVASGRPLKPGERGQLRDLLQLDGRDRIVAFRPVTRRTDGSYTVLWQVLMNNPKPTLTDLDRYVSLNLQTRGKN